MSHMVLNPDCWTEGGDITFWSDPTHPLQIRGKGKTKTQNAEIFMSNNQKRFDFIRTNLLQAAFLLWSWNDSGRDRRQRQFWGERCFQAVPKTASRSDVTDFWPNGQQCKPSRQHEPCKAHKNQYRGTPIFLKIERLKYELQALSQCQ